MIVLKGIFLQLTSRYSSDNTLKEKLWAELAKQYSSHKRHYHTLEHLQALLDQLLEIKTSINNWDVVLFSLFYHDSVYNTLRSDNEEKSAVLAGKRLRELGTGTSIIEECKTLIMATKSHSRSPNEDHNYFMDADLSVLGQDWNIYTNYYKNVRKEYSIYPDLVYNPGRVKVLRHFLEMDRIFKTDHFYTKLETPARLNIEKEIEVLMSKS